jgi:murein DD-endopeptidase MepM/ murein hydrolase activator NlpD
LSQPFGCSPFYTGIPGPGCPAEAPWFHDGIDLAAPVGTPVRAALTGTVIFTGPDGRGPLCGEYRGYGLGVVVDDGEWQSLYAHLSRIDVVVGQAVTPATIIGASGETGCVSGPHLHFGLRRQERLVDPLTYLPERW